MIKYKLFLSIFLSVFFALNITAQDKMLSVEDAVIGMWRQYRPKQKRNLQWKLNSHDYTFIKGDKLIQSGVKSEKDEEIIKYGEVIAYTEEDISAVSRELTAL